MSNILEIRNLSVSFKTDEGIVRAVQDVSLSIPRGEVVGLVGESGCGKSVTAMSVLRLVPSPPAVTESGEFIYDGKNLLSMPIEDLRNIRGKSISVIFQEPMTALSPLHRIGYQLAEALRLHESMSKKDAWARGLEWLEKVGIPSARENMYSYPFQLSGGMRQRVMIAMALMLEPDLVIADEPTTALDVTIQAQIFDIMRDMKKQDTSVLLITHDMGVVWEMCSQVTVMYASELVESGTTGEIFNDLKHPCTTALLKSVPSLAEKAGRLDCIEGQVPSPGNYPKGCRFQDRCSHVMPVCRDRHPQLDQHEGRPVRCFLYEAKEPGQ